MSFTFRSLIQSTIGMDETTVIQSFTPLIISGGFKEAGIENVKEFCDKRDEIINDIEFESVQKTFIETVTKLWSVEPVEKTDSDGNTKATKSGVYTPIRQALADICDELNALEIDEKHAVKLRMTVTFSYDEKVSKGWTSSINAGLKGKTKKPPNGQIGSNGKGNGSLTSSSNNGQIGSNSKGNGSLTSWSKDHWGELKAKGSNKVRLLLRAAINAGISIGDYHDYSKSGDVLPDLEDQVMEKYDMSDTISNLTMEGFCKEYKAAKLTNTKFVDISNKNVDELIHIKNCGSQTDPGELEFEALIPK